MLRIAVQSKGRLYDETMELLQESGISLGVSKRTLLVQAGPNAKAIYFSPLVSVLMVTLPEITLLIASKAASKAESGVYSGTIALLKSINT